MKKKRKKKPVTFGRVLVPATRPHTTKKGARGYSRDETKREVREEFGEARRPEPRQGKA